VVAAAVPWRRGKYDALRPHAPSRGDANGRPDLPQIWTTTMVAGAFMGLPSAAQCNDDGFQRDKSRNPPLGLGFQKLRLQLNISIRI
jgi:hypothetical protein